MRPLLLSPWAPSWQKGSAVPRLVAAVAEPEDAIAPVVAEASAEVACVVSPVPPCRPRGRASPAWPEPWSPLPPTAAGNDHPPSGAVAEGHLEGESAARASAAPSLQFETCQAD
eukprot:6943162-Pyramimonas_sp.AAC.1